MGYRYSFDETPVGDWQLSRQKFAQLHESLKMLLDKIEVWNQKALNHGALEAPYDAESLKLKSMIEFGEGELAKSHQREIVIRRISVGSLRYAKAALLTAIYQQEEEIGRKEAQNWPESVLESVRRSVEPLRLLEKKIPFPPADIFAELNFKSGMPAKTYNSSWDVFICHASEDKDEFVRPLAEALRNSKGGLKVWYDEFSLTVGDSLRKSIDRGLAHSQYGVVVLSPNFFAKDWPQRELDGLMTREVNGLKVILPVWHKIDIDGVRSFSPMLADRVATKSNRGLESVVKDILSGMGLVS